MSLVLSLLAGVVIVFAITVATGYFVAQEFAYMAVDRSRLAARAEAGDAVAERTLGITRRTSFMLSGAQLGITVTGLLVGYVAEPLIGSALADSVDGWMSASVAITLGSILALVFSTFVQMLFGELFPKNYSIAKSEAMAGRLSRSTSIYLTIFGPLIWVFDKSSELFLRMLRIEPVHDVEHSATALDLAHVVQESRDRGELSPEKAAMLDRILDFPQQYVEHALVPRSRVDVVRADTTIGEVRELMTTGHTRYPVLDDEDEIVGVAHLVDILDVPDINAPVSTAAREAHVISTLMSLPEALKSMDEARQVLACVVDEYGGFDGILTIEDLAEEIVGEITDEHDPDDETYEPVPDDGIWVMGGDVHVDEIERSLQVELPEGDFETVAGLVIDAHGELPEVGTTVHIELPVDPVEAADDEDLKPQVLNAEVLEVERYVPSRVRLTIEDENESDDESEEQA